VKGGGWGYDVEEGWSGRGLGRVLGRMGWGSLVGLVDYGPRQVETG